VYVVPPVSHFLPFTDERERNDEAAEFAGEGGKWSGVPRFGGEEEC
jgi:hypothetical protein